MVGSTTHLPLPNHPETRFIFVLIQDEVFHCSIRLDFQVQPLLFRTHVLERLRLPLLQTEPRVSVAFQTTSSDTEPHILGPAG